MPSSRPVSRMASSVDCDRDAVVVAGPALEHGDLVVAQVAARARSARRCCGRSARPARGSRRAWRRRRCRSPGAAGPGRRSRRSSRRASTPVTRADHDRCRRRRRARASCSLHLVGPVRRSRARRAGGRTRRPGWRTASAAPRARPRGPCSQLSLKPMPKPAGSEPHLGAHDPGQQDVADPVVDGVRPVDPALLHQHAPSGRASRRPRRPAGCGWTGRRRSTPGCRRPARARRGRGTRACGSCCRRTRARCCSPRAWPRWRAPPR